MEMHAAAKTAKVTATPKPAHMAAAKPAEATAAAEAHMAKAPAGQPSSAAVESEAVVELMMEATPSDKETRTPPVVEAEIRVAPAIVVTGAIIRPIVVVTAVRVTSGGASNHSGHRGAGIGVMTRAAMGVVVDIAIGIKAAVGVRRPPVNGVDGVMNGGRRVCGGR